MQKTAAIICAVDFNERHFTESHRSGSFDALIAVDAGYRHLERLSIVPDAVIGDFDSLGYVPEGSDIRVYPEKKDESDFELAIACAADAGCDTLWVYGAVGGRIDQTLCALQVAAAASEAGFKVALVSPRDAVYVLTGPASLRLQAPLGATVSLVSASDVCLGVCAEGFEWPLCEASLSSRTSRGLSNVVTGGSPVVSVSSGTLFIIVNME